jgi:hypothetical protein
MSELDKARAALKGYGLLPGFVGALERFEAAVRANERSGETRAAVLREATAEIERDPMGCVPRLRRMADEAEQP